jgi:hypothetical protein
MKTYTSLLIPVLLISLKCSAQNLDANGIPSSIVKDNNTAPFMNPASLSPYVYDSVRAISEINVNNSADAYPWISADGLRLYYVCNNLGHLGFTSRPNTSSYFATPVIADPVFPANTMSCWFSADELDVYYTSSSTIYYAHRTSIASAFSTPVMISVTGAFPFAGISLDPTQNELYFYTSSYGMARCIRTGLTSFALSYFMQSPLGSFNPGQLSKDGLVFFTSLASGLQTLIYSMSRSTLADSLTNPQLVQGLNDMTIDYNSQATTSDSLQWVVLVRTPNNSWSEDDLFIARLSGTVTSVFDPAKENFTPVVYPNPVADKLYFKISNAAINKPVIEIYSAQNTLIASQGIDANATVDVSRYAEGVYFYKIYAAGNATLHNGKFVVMH